MKVLIAGGTGFIGKSLSSYLLSKGYTVHVLTRNPKKLVQATRYHTFLWNPYKGSIDKSCIEGVEIIINLAGESISGSWSKKGKAKILRSRERPAQFLFRFLKTTPNQVHHLIGASAIGIYADIQEQQSESKFSRANTFLADVVEKWEAEHLKFEELGIGVCLLRIGLVLSLEGGALPEMVKPLKYYIAAPLGRGTQVYSWIHLEDLKRMVAYVLEQRLTGVYNAVACEPETNLQFTKTMAACNGIGWTWPPIPTLVLKLLLGEKHQLLTQGQSVSNEKIKTEGFEFKYATLEKALQNLSK